MPNCLLCEKPLATEADYETTKECEGTHLCWSKWSPIDCTRFGQERQIIAELRAIVGRLPRYADTGKPFVDRVDPQWVIHPHYGVLCVESLIPNTATYSTQAAAEAAAATIGKESQ